MQDHRKLRLWRLAHQIAIDVRKLTERFPRRGYAEFKEQITGSAESIASNIVEGCGAATQREFARFLDMAIKSTKEVEERLELARDYGILAEETWDRLTTDTIDDRKMLFGLRKQVLAAAAADEAEAKAAAEKNAKRKTRPQHGKRQTRPLNG